MMPKSIKEEPMPLNLPVFSPYFMQAPMNPFQNYFEGNSQIAPNQNAITNIFNYQNVSEENKISPEPGPSSEHYNYFDWLGATSNLPQELNNKREIKTEEHSNTKVHLPILNGLTKEERNLPYSRHQLKHKSNNLLDPGGAFLNEPVKSERSNLKAKSPRKKIDRFDGTPEEEVSKKFLPDHICHGLEILIIGINPGLFAAHKGHHYAGPGNHFWKCLYLSGLTEDQCTADDDFKMLEKGIGFTNMVARTTRGSADLKRNEIEEGAKILLTKLHYYRPKIAVFNGKGIYEVFSKKKKFLFGKQPETIPGTDILIWVMPSSSARCAQLPRAINKVPYYEALRKLRDNLRGDLPFLSQEELVFDKLKSPPKSNCKLERLGDANVTSSQNLVLESGVAAEVKDIIKKEEV